jgi:phosphatidylinositol-4,5-bisphosphate 3-kinase
MILIHENKMSFLIWLHPSLRELPNTSAREQLRIRFTLILEAYCRGCGPYLNELLKQTDAVSKLETLSQLVKERKEELCMQELRHNMKKLEQFESPLDSAHWLGKLMYAF